MHNRILFSLILIIASWIGLGQCATGPIGHNVPPPTPRSLSNPFGSQRYKGK